MLLLGNLCARITAIKNTIRICRDKNLLKEYLENRAAEVENIMLTLFDQEEVMDIYLYNAVADVPHLYRWRGPCASDRVEHISPPASKAR